MENIKKSRANDMMQSKAEEPPILKTKTAVKKISVYPE